MAVPFELSEEITTLREIITCQVHLFQKVSRTGILKQSMMSTVSKQGVVQGVQARNNLGSMLLLMRSDPPLVGGSLNFDLG